MLRAHDAGIDRKRVVPPSGGDDDELRLEPVSARAGDLREQCSLRIRDHRDLALEVASDRTARRVLRRRLVRCAGTEHRAQHYERGPRHDAVLQ